jgi:hypothetical protein
VADPLIVLGEPIGANDSDRCTGTTPAAERGILSEADARGLHEGWSMARSSTPSWVNTTGPFPICCGVTSSTATSAERSSH